MAVFYNLLDGTVQSKLVQKEQDIKQNSQDGNGWNLNQTPEVKQEKPLGQKSEVKNQEPKKDISKEARKINDKSQKDLNTNRLVDAGEVIAALKSGRGLKKVAIKMRDPQVRSLVFQVAKQDKTLATALKNKMKTNKVFARSIKRSLKTVKDVADFRKDLTDISGNNRTELLAMARVVNNSNKRLGQSRADVSQLTPALCRVIKQGKKTQRKVAQIKNPQIKQITVKPEIAQRLTNMAEKVAFQLQTVQKNPEDVQNKSVSLNPLDKFIGIDNGIQNEGKKKPRVYDINGTSYTEMQLGMMLQNASLKDLRTMDDDLMFLPKEIADMIRQKEYAAERQNIAENDTNHDGIVDDNDVDLAAGKKDTNHDGFITPEDEKDGEIEQDKENWVDLLEEEQGPGEPVVEKNEEMTEEQKKEQDEAIDEVFGDLVRGVLSMPGNAEAFVNVISKEIAVVENIIGEALDTLSGNQDEATNIEAPVAPKEQHNDNSYYKTHDPYHQDPYKEEYHRKDEGQQQSIDSKRQEINAEAAGDLKEGFRGAEIEREARKNHPAQPVEQGQQGEILSR